ncbi:iron chelate uptake ABC transporter family permease subunit, partial [Cribrihabitans sp. XS_ASV171]
MRALEPLLLLGVLALFVLSLVIGPADVSAGESLAALFSDEYGAMTLVMREIRLPRALLAIAIGAGLGMAGAAMQGYLRNPLAEPGLIGVSGSAALGAVLAIHTGLAASSAL